MTEIMELLKGQLSKIGTDWYQPAIGEQPMPGQEIVREAMLQDWTIDKISGILATALVIIVIFIVVAQAWTNKKLVGGFQETNKELLKANAEIARENQTQMARLTEAVNNLSSETRRDISVLNEKVEGLEDTIRVRQMMP